MVKVLGLLHLSSSLVGSPAAPQPSPAPNLNTASVARAPSVSSFPNWKRKKSSNQRRKGVGRSLWRSNCLLRARTPSKYIKQVGALHWRVTEVATGKKLGGKCVLESLHSRPGNLRQWLLWQQNQEKSPSRPQSWHYDNAVWQLRRDVGWDDGQEELSAHRCPCGPRTSKT